MLIDYYSNSAPVGSACVSTPDACIFDLQTVRLKAVSESLWLDGADFYSAELWKPSVASWVEYATDVDTGETVVIETPYEIGLKARWVAHVGASVYYSDEIAVTTFCCEGQLPPETPDLPTLLKDCEAGTVTVTSPEFSEVEDAETTSIELRRRFIGGVWESVHTFEAEGDWDDETVLPASEYEYSARACNDFGCSDWSTPATVSLISTTLALAWQSPAAASEVSGKTLFRFTAIDAVGAGALQVFVNGALVAATPKRVSGTAQSGTYTLVLDTRRAVQGAAVISVLGTGSDGCKKRADLSLTFANVRAQGVLYRDFVTDTAVTGEQITRLPLSLSLGELDSDPSQRFWGQVAITNDVSTPIVTDATDPVAAQTAFDAMQPFPVVQAKSWPQLGLNPPGSILYGIQTVNNAAPQLKVRVRQEVAEAFLAYDTGGETIPKIREIEAGKYLVFAQNPDKVFVFEEEALSLLANIESLESLSNVSDVALLEDKLFFVNNARLYAIDTDAGSSRTLEYSLRGENRTPVFIETIGDKIICILVGETGDKTLAISIQGNQVADAWTLEYAATLAWSDGADLYFACGGDFYRSENGTDEPELIGSFASDISAISATEGTAAIGLSDGALWVLADGIWTQVVLAGGDAIAATSRAFLNFEFQNHLWGKAETATLYGQSGGGNYDVTRALGEYDGVVNQPTGIASLGRYFVPEGGTGGGMGEVNETAGDERALVGTAGGVLLALAVAKQSSASAWLHSSISDIESGAVARLIPAG